jgi:hypothetical protein
MTSYSYNLSNIVGFNTLVDTNGNNLNILKLNKFQCKSTNSLYNIIRYDKDVLNMDIIPTYGLCRSVILNNKKQVVSFAPPKSLYADTFMKQYNEMNDSIVAQEFVEGTMINVFFDETIGEVGSWEIATRSNVGANNIFFKSDNAKSFRKLFMEAAVECNLDINCLNRQLCYSFVLQHPENRIVVPFKTPQLYLVAVYCIRNEPNNVHVEFGNVYNYTRYFQEIGSNVKFPEIYREKDYSALINKYCSMNTSYDIQGVVLYNKETGERSKIRNPVYEQVKHLRGNQPKLQYQYLCLRRQGKVKDYLKYYPENKKEFSKFRDQVHLFTNTLYSNYKSCYIQKEKPLNQFPKQYSSNMYYLHQHYMDHLRENKLYINNTIVQNYVNNLHPSVLMYCLNYDMRKHTIDTIVSDNS